jgi:hypothetical protein
MFKLLVYSNLVFAVLYFLFYLQDGSWYAISGILMVIVFSVMAMMENFRSGRIIKMLFYLASIASGIFSGFLVFSSLYILLDAIDHGYFPFQIMLLCALGLAFSFFTLSLLVCVFLFKDHHGNN